MKKLTVEVLLERLKDRPWLKLNLSTFKNIRTQALFIDDAYGEFWATPHQIIYQGSNHPLRGAAIKASKNTKYPQNPDIVESLVKKDRPWISLKKETFISFCKSCIWVDDTYGEFNLSPYQVIIKGSQHFTRSKTHPADEVEKEIQKQKPHLSIDKSTYKNKRTKFRLIDSEYGDWWGTAANLIRGVGDHPERIKATKVIPLNEIISKLPRGISLLEETYNGISNKCQFLDSEFGLFEALPYRVISGGSRHPERKNHWTDEKIDQLILNKNIPIRRLSSFTKSYEPLLFEDLEFGTYSCTVNALKEGHSHKRRGYNKLIKNKDKIIEYLAINRPFIKLIDYKGSTVSSLFLDEKFGEYSMIPRRILQEGGLHPKRIETDIENIFSSILNIPRFNKTPPEILGSSFKNYRPDFKLDSKTYVNCDGLFWHSEANKDKNYHFKLREEFDSVGLKLLQFYSDEIKNKSNIIKSICLNSIGNTSIKIGARKTKIQNIKRDFFEKNHLMGAHFSSRSIGLIFEGQVVAGMSYKLQKKTLFIERFCSVLNTTVVGAFTKLLNYIIKIYQPTTVINFVDLRYGTGKNLLTLGFELEKIHLGFKWTNGTKTFHRLKCKANMDFRKLSEKEYAEELGWFKIYDAGQAKYVLHIKN